MIKTQINLSGLIGIAIIVIVGFIFLAFPQNTKAQGPPGPPSSPSCDIYGQDLQNLILELNNLVDNPIYLINRTDVNDKLLSIRNLLHAIPSNCNCQTQLDNALNEINQLITDVFNVPKESLKEQILGFFIPAILDSVSMCLDSRQPIIPVVLLVRDREPANPSFPPVVGPRTIAEKVNILNNRTIKTFTDVTAALVQEIKDLTAERFVNLADFTGKGVIYFFNNYRI